MKQSTSKPAAAKRKRSAAAPAPKKIADRQPARGSKKAPVGRRAVASPTTPPTVTLTFSSARAPMFAFSKVPELRDLEMSQWELLQRAAELSKHDITQIALEGAIERAKKIVATLGSSNAAGAGRGIMGSADDRMQVAYESLTKAGSRVTPSLLAAACKPPSSYRTAQRWLRQKGL